jgi:hypothetical protein
LSIRCSRGLLLPSQAAPIRGFRFGDCIDPCARGAFPE